MNIEEKLYTLRWKHDKQSHISITRADVCLDRCGA